MAILQIADYGNTKAKVGRRISQGLILKINRKLEARGETALREMINSVILN